MFNKNINFKVIVKGENTVITIRMKCTRKEFKNISKRLTLKFANNDILKDGIIIHTNDYTLVKKCL